MNQNYVSELERVVHASRFNLIKATQQIKELSAKQKKLQNALKVVRNENVALNNKLSFEKEKYVCNVCYEQTKDCIIVPCKHFAGCRSCCMKLDKCPICRCEIKSYINLFVS